MQNFVVPAGRVAIGVSSLSYCEVVRIAVTADSSVLSNAETHEICANMERAVNTYIKLAKSQTSKKDQ